MALFFKREADSGKPGNDPGDHFLLLLTAQAREDGKGERLECSLLGNRKITLLVAEVGEALLQVEWDGIVDRGADLAVREKLLKGIPLPSADPDHILVEDVMISHRVGLIAVWLRRQNQAVKESRCGEEFAVGFGIRSARGVPTVKEREFCP
jgi:hypothetical protein